jgi:hypothetical protein
MDVGEQRQLRQWADRLAVVDDPERRAMGRAISLLLDRIDQLERELTSTAGQALPAPEVVSLDPAHPADTGEDTQQLSLRDRLRLATDGLRDRGEQR